MTPDLASALLACDLCDAAYNFSATDSLHLPEGFMPMRPIRATKPCSLLKCDPEPVWGFVIEGLANQQYVVFRGTQDIYHGRVFPWEWLADAKAWPLVNCGRYGSIHPGFLEVHESLDIDGIGPNPLYLGHSLGGAIAAIDYVQRGVKGDLWTFNAPMTGDSMFGSRLIGTKWFANRWDRVSALPGVPPYTRGGTRLGIDGSSGSLIAEFEAVKAHSLASCRVGIQRLYAKAAVA